MRSISRRTIDRDDAGSVHDLQEDDALPQLPPPGTFPSSSSTLSPHDRIRQSTSTSSTGSTLTGGRRGSADTMKAASSAGGSSTRGAGANILLDNGGIVKPIITVRAEHGSIARSLERDTKQHLTCMVTIEMPARWAPPAPAARYPDSIGEEREREESYGEQNRQTMQSGQSDSSYLDHPRRPSSPTASSVYSAYAYTPTAVPSLPADPFASVVDELKKRMQDWKGHSPDEFGLLKLFDYIHVRKEKNVREFLVYVSLSLARLWYVQPTQGNFQLFEEAILCVSADKRRGLTGKIVDGLAGSSDKLRLKGRVYVRHIRSVIDSSQPGGELSLTVTMSDDALDEFCMTFNDKQSLEHWKRQIESLVAAHRAPPPPPPAASSGVRSRDTVGSASNTSMAGSEWSDSSRSAAHSSAFSGYTRTTSSSAPPLSAVIQEEDAREMRNFNQSSPRGSTYSGQQLAPSSPSAPRDFTPLDLMLVLSVPHSGPTSLKVGIIKSCLEFILQSVGPRTRLSIVAFSVGDGPHGILRKTPFIAIGTTEGRARMEAVINEMGSGSEEDSAMIDHKESRVNVVTAVNLAMDVVLQRKVRLAIPSEISDKC